MILRDLSKMKKKLETLQQIIRIYSQNIEMESGIEKCAMLIMEKRETMEETELPNQKRIRTLGVKKKGEKKEKKIQIPGSIRSRHHKAIRDERKSKKGVPQKNKKTFQN